ncbi:MAG: hypothetical protein Q8L44_10730 [Sulfuritalea sp.]|nr:hypothetical protein [Sulfuritalea sp.]
MTARPKAAPKAATKSSPKAVPKAEPKAKARPVEPFLRFYHSDELRAKTLAVLGALEEDSDPENHRDTLADLVAELTESGMSYYYLRALKLAKAGFVVEQSARLGMSGAVKLITSVTRKFIVRMDSAQLLVVSRHIRALAI